MHRHVWYVNDKGAGCTLCGHFSPKEEESREGTPISRYFAPDITMPCESKDVKEAIHRSEENAEWC